MWEKVGGNIPLEELGDIKLIVPDCIVCRGFWLLDAEVGDWWNPFCMPLAPPFDVVSLLWFLDVWVILLLLNNLLDNYD